jgi:hypothetical protein
MMSLASILVLLSFSFSAFAQTRTLVLEFEPVEGSTRYDIEFRQIGSEKIFKAISTIEAEVEIVLPFHHYEYRQRALDKRKIAGSWSNWEQFDVAIPELKILSPTANTLIDTNEEKTQNVKLEWIGADGIKEFEIKIIDVNSQKEIEKFTTKKNTVEVDLPVAAQYEISVSTILPEEIPSDLISQAKTQFALLAKPLEKPKIEPVTNLYSQKVTWKQAEWAETYNVSLYSYSAETKKWMLVYTNETLSSTELLFDPKWRGGKYRLKVQANAGLRKTSPAQTESFKLASVRTPAAEYSAMLIKTIDRVNGYFTQVSWLMTEMNLNSFVYDTSTYSNAHPVGGTVGASLGYFESGKPWGIIGNFSTSRMILNNETKGFSSVDVSSMYRHKFFDRDELRLSLGFSAKQVPVIIGDSFNKDFTIHNADVKGPKMAFEYWFALGPKWGLQANYNQNFFNLISNSSAPNGKRLKMTESFRAGFMTSYQFTDKITGLVGLTHQEDAYEYETSAVIPSGGFVPPDARNNGQLKADYIGLMVEIGL